jgi:hypothetical protein
MSMAVDRFGDRLTCLQDDDLLTKAKSTNLLRFYVFSESDMIYVNLEASDSISLPGAPHVSIPPQPLDTTYRTTYLCNRLAVDQIYHAMHVFY